MGQLRQMAQNKLLYELGNSNVYCHFSKSNNSFLNVEDNLIIDVNNWQMKNHINNE